MKKQRNSYRAILPNGKTAGVVVFETCSNRMGNDFPTWPQHPEYHSTLAYCHEHVLKRTDTYNPNGGLALRIQYLIRAPKYGKETQRKRPCYHDACVDALQAGVITHNQYYQYVKF